MEHVVTAEMRRIVLHGLREPEIPNHGHGQTPEYRRGRADGVDGRFGKIRKPVSCMLQPRRPERVFFLN